MKLTTGTERGPSILDSIIPVVDLEAPMSKGTSSPPAYNIRQVITLQQYFNSMII